MALYKCHHYLLLLLLLLLIEGRHSTMKLNFDSLSSFLVSLKARVVQSSRRLNRLTYTNVTIRIIVFE